MKVDSFLKCVLLIAAIITLAVTGLLIYNIDRRSEGIFAGLQNTINDVDATVIIIRGAAVNVSMTLGRIEEASASWKDASDKQRAYFEAIKAKSLTTLDTVNTLSESLNTLVQNTDVSINRGLLPKVDTAIEETTATIRSANASVVTLQEGSKVVLEDMHAILADESIPASLKAIEGSASNAEIATEHAAKSAEYIEGYLSPKKAGFWAKLIQFFIPKFSIDLK